MEPLRPKRRQALLKVLSALFFSIVPSIVISWSETGVMRQVVSMLTLLAVTAMMFILEKEKLEFPQAGRALKLFAAGALVSFVYVAASGGIVGSVDENVPGWFIGLVFVDTVALIPFYEEKLVRGLLLRGLAGLTGNIPAIAITAVLFAFVHKGNEASAFAGGLALAWLAIYKNCGVVDRSIIHGAWNMVPVVWIIISAASSSPGQAI